MVATVGAAAADASSQAAGADRSTPLSCEYDDYTPPRLGGEWTATFEDGLAADSQARWDGGRIVQVGVGGDCSLFVADGRTAMLPNVTVNGTRGVVTGTVDLGADGQLRFVDAAAGSGPSVTGSPVATATARSPNRPYRLLRPHRPHRPRPGEPRQGRRRSLRIRQPTAQSPRRTRPRS
ncbi:hypothetical protein ACFQL4_16380 [Halosimplex aquaticum]